MVQDTRNRLIQAITHQAGKISYFCTAENIPANLAVHELRKSFKRLRALLRFYTEIPETNIPQLRNDIRNFGKLLAPLRESSVNLDLFDKEVPGNKLLPERKIKNAREMLVQKNKSLLERGFRENNLNKTIESFFDEFETLISDNPGNEQLTKIHFFREVGQTYLKSITVYQQLPLNPHPEEWHQLRKKLKQLWYQLDFIRFLHPRYFKLKTDQLNKITDQLGEDHDLHIFSEELISQGYGFAKEEVHILKNQVEHLRELNQIKLHPRLKQFFSAPPGEFNQKLERFFKL
ncbi:CHAD domain-containing protein [Mariniphaga sediminis]|uniref:CHAD domain-containing protein n=1 Tax=Mariniphaga sediminis TaxID=1628158 RepID=UPI00356683DC